MVTFRTSRSSADLALARGFAQWAQIRSDYVVVGDRQDREPRVVERPDDLIHRVTAVALLDVLVQIRSVLLERVPIDSFVGIAYLDPAGPFGGAAAHHRDCKHAD
jgi:hypothetical protein